MGSYLPGIPPKRSASHDRVRLLLGQVSPNPRWLALYLCQISCLATLLIGACIMTIDYEALKRFPFEDRVHSYDERDTMLYALGIGLGADPLDERELRFVFEADLQALPTMAVTLATSRPWLHRPESGVTFSQMLHGEQWIELHRPIQPSGELVGKTSMDEIVDKGPGKGALLYMSRVVSDKASGEPNFTARQTLFCRADGGVGGPVTDSRPVHPLPERAPDLSVDVPTLERQPLIYRLSGDRNPLHADPATAKSAGFDRPILHGLCTFGIAGYAILKSVADYQPEALRSIGARFASPVFPGETIRTEIWEEGSGRVGFRCRAVERDLVVVNNGIAELG